MARIALFIDGENTSPKLVTQALGHCTALGRLTIRRIYGNADSLKKWALAATEHCIVPVQTPPSAKKQNASDFALTIDAVTLLHRGLFDHAVIMSSDADFILLAMHIRENGTPVSGMGEAKTPKSLQSAFDDFILLDQEKPKPAARAAPPAKKAASARKTHGERGAPAESKISASHLIDIYEDLSNGNREVNVRNFADRLSKLQPDYKKGFRTAANFLNKSGLFTVTGKTVTRNP